MRIYLRTWRVAAVIGVLAMAPHAATQEPVDWPVFRGNPLQTGVADRNLPADLKVRWTFKTGEAVTAAPVIAGDTAYIGGIDGKLYALDLATGRPRWIYPAASFKATPAVRDGAVYIGDTFGVFHCVDAATGKKRWTLALDGPIAASANFAGERVLFGCDDHRVYCVSAQGQVLWRYQTKEKIQSAAAVAGARVIVAGCDQCLHVIDLASGDKVACIPIGAHIGASPAVHGDHVYVGHMANQFVAVDWKKGEVLWRFEARRGAEPFYASAAVTEELVITGSRDKQVRALQRQTGKEVWAFATKGKVDSSPVVVGQRVLVGSVDGGLYVLDLGRGTQVARVDLRSPITNAAAVGDNCVVVATFPGQVCCLTGRNP